MLLQRTLRTVEAYVHRNAFVHSTQQIRARSDYAVERQGRVLVVHQHRLVELLEVLGPPQVSLRRGQSQLLGWDVRRERQLVMHRIQKNKVLEVLN